MADDTVPTIDYLHQCFDADLEAGVLTWRTRSREHFANAGAWVSVNKRFSGTVAGTLHGHGYSHVMLTIGGKSRRYLTHRIIWALAHGRWPDQEIDHINGDPSDNRISNLREATHGENSQNQRMRSTNTSGFPGVSPHKRSGKSAARIEVAGRHIHLGLFDTPELAYAARCDAQANYFPFQPVQRNMTEEQTAVEAYAWFRRRAWREIV